MAAVWGHLLFLLYFCSTGPDTPFVLWMLWTGYFFRTVLRGQGKRCVLVVYQPRECLSSAHPQSKRAQIHGPKSGTAQVCLGHSRHILTQDWDRSHTALPAFTKLGWHITAGTHCSTKDTSQWFVIPNLQWTRSRNGQKLHDHRHRKTAWFRLQTPEL